MRVNVRPSYADPSSVLRRTCEKLREVTRVVVRNKDFRVGDFATIVDVNVFVSPIKETSELAKKGVPQHWGVI